MQKNLRPYFLLVILRKTRHRETHQFDERIVDYLVIYLQT
jgi:hypothetical protein